MISMAQLVVRNLDDDVKAKLRRRADAHGRSMEAEVRDILRNAAHEAENPSRGLGTEIAAIFRGSGINFEAEELRGHSVVPVKFDE